MFQGCGPLCFAIVALSCVFLRAQTLQNRCHSAPKARNSARIGLIMRSGLDIISCIFTVLMRLRLWQHDREQRIWPLERVIGPSCAAIFRNGAQLHTSSLYQNLPEGADAPVHVGH